jgi:regulator of protease activity HflC (stomatin/prohibitin superfamily)
MTTPEAPPYVAAAATFTRPLYAAVGAALAAATVAFAIQPLLGDDTLAPLAIYALLVAVVLAATARMSQLRQAMGEARERRDGLEAADPAPPASAGGPLDAPTVAPHLARQTERLERFAREGVAVAFSVGGAAGLGVSWLVFRAGLEVTPGGPFTTLVGLGLAGLAFWLLVASRATLAIPAARLPETAGLADWLRGAQWMALLTGLGFLSRSVPWIPRDWSHGLAVALLAVSALCALELWIRGIWQGIRPRASRRDAGVPLALLTLSTLFQGRSALHGALAGAERRLGLSLRSAWALAVLRRSLVPLVIGLAGVLWASTTLVVIRPEEQGLRFRLGRLISPVPLEPGLRLKRPWPLEVVERYPVRRVQTLGLGHAGPSRGSLLWGRQHTGEEYQLLLGDGRELVSADATVAYRVRDVVAFALAVQNPRETLEALAYRLLTKATVTTTLDRLLTADRGSFARRFATELQGLCDAEGLGLEILHVGFISLHPPVGIAQAYEDVVSAEIERGTLVVQARADRERSLPAAQAEANREVQDADGEATRRLADARGAAAGFVAALRAHQAAPALFRFRRRLEAVEEALPDRRLFVIDQRLGAATGDLWIDLRPAPETPNPETPP